MTCAAGGHLAPPRSSSGGCPPQRVRSTPHHRRTSERVSAMESNLAPTRVRRQHYVPQMHLKAFANGDSRVVTVHDLEEGRAFKASTKNIAVGVGFYDVEAEGSSLSPEGWLAKLEGAAAPIVARLIDSPPELLNLRTDEESSLARFLVTLYLRGPAYRDAHQQRTDDVMTRVTTFQNRVLARRADEGGSRTGEGGNRPSLPDQWWREHNEFRADARFTASILSGATGFENLLRVKPWRIGCVPDGLPLYTSDNPMSWWIKPVRPWWEHGALDYLDFWIALSPHVLLRLGRARFSEHELVTGDVKSQGPREFRNFTAHEASVARHVISLRATRFLVGDASPVSRSCAMSCISRLEDAMRITAEELRFSPAESQRP